jgi:tetratricopeptide (TPR) repeat protein
VVCDATPTIIGTGDLAAADEFVIRFPDPDPDPNPWFAIIQSRMHAAAGRYDEAAAVALQAEQVGAQMELVGPSFNLVRALNRLHLGIQRHDPAMRVAASVELAAGGDLELASIARAADSMCEASMAGSLAELCAELVVSAGLSRQKNHRRYEGISLNNLALTENARGNHDAAVVAGEAALSLLEFAGDNNDIAAAHLNVARGLAHGSRWPECQRHLDAALSSTTGWVDPEVIAEAADIVAAYGDPQRASRIFEGTANRAERSPADMYIRLVKAHLELQRGRPKVARTLLPPLDAQAFVPGFRTSLMAFELQIQAFEAGRNPGMDAAFQAALELRLSRRLLK